MATTYKPPASFTPAIKSQKFSVFLAGSIEMGTAPDWQAEVENQLADLDMVIYNPRRDDWDPTWVQSADNPKFREQVEWELSALDIADLILIYLAPGTVSPISLLELGIHAAKRYYTREKQPSFRHENIILCCPEGFQRKGNVDIICERYFVQQVKDLDSLSDSVRWRYKNWEYNTKLHSN